MDSATAHCYQARANEQAASSDHFLGCWVRTLGGGEQFSLSVDRNGYFYANFDGGDYFGSELGRWEESNGGLVLFPVEGECALDSVFQDACVRIFNADEEGVSIRIAEQVLPDIFEEVVWQRGVGCLSAEEALEELTPEDSGCLPEHLEPVGVVDVNIDIHPSDGVASPATIEFSLSPELQEVDKYDVQRNLIPSVRTFTLRDPRGDFAIQFIRHADSLNDQTATSGGFDVSARRDKLTVSFTHRFVVLPAELELNYEFRDAKYVADTGPRSVVFSLAQP